MQMTKVSVIIPVYNGEKYLSETLDSIIGQTFTDWEIVAVNDGSSDNSLNVLCEYQSKLGLKMKVINQKNRGVSVARNVAIDTSEGEYLAFIDADDIWLPEKLEKQIELLEDNRNVALVYSNLLNLIGKNKTQRKQLINKKLHRGKIFDPLFYFNFIPLSSVVVRKKIIEKYGNFNIHYKIIQDYDILLRIAEDNEIDYVNDKLLLYRIHINNISSNVEVKDKENLELIKEWIQKKPYLVNSFKFNIKMVQMDYDSIRYYLYKRNYSCVFNKIIPLITNFIGFRKKAFLE